jgi:hypothetical protein
MFNDHQKKRARYGLLTCFSKVLTWSDYADSSIIDVHDGRGGERRKNLWNEKSTLKMGLNGRNAESSVVGLGINEGTQERKSDCGREEHIHDGDGGADRGKKGLRIGLVCSPFLNGFGVIKHRSNTSC